MSANPFLNLSYEPAIYNLGDDYYDQVSAAEFPQHFLRFRNDDVLKVLGLDPQAVTDDHFIEAFGRFEAVTPFLALRYHGYQFGEYNPYLGDGRGFVYGQMRGLDGDLYDFGTKGSGRTPHSRSADGRLTLKGGVREVLAAEALFQLGVNTSRCFSMIETGEALWRGDEPSPTGSSVMIRFSRSHIRFGTFERLHYIKRPDLIQRLLDHVIGYYYPEVFESDNPYGRFYETLVKRVATLVAQWMAAGFCHGVLNTDNMSITGESFDYGPYAFIPTYNPNFTAAYFDYGGRYSFGNQPYICRLNLEMLQVPLSLVIPRADLEAGLKLFDDCYNSVYTTLMLQKLGFENLSPKLGDDLLYHTILLLQNTQVGYHAFFAQLAQEFNHGWRDNPSLILENSSFIAGWDKWQGLYQQALQEFPVEDLASISSRLSDNNPKTALLRPVIESIWEPIAQDNNWEPFYNLLKNIGSRE